MSYIDLDLNLVKTFLVVYESKSIALASKRLFVSQPAVTKSIKRLEEYLGGKLFVRTPRGVVPTNEGEDFSKTCYSSLKILENGINSFSMLANLESGKLNIGSSSTIIRKILLPFIDVFNKKYPNIVISILDANSEDLAKCVKNRLIDLAILNMPLPNVNDFYVVPIMQTHDCFISSVSSSKDYSSIDELKEQKLILQKRPSSNRDYFEQMCEKNNITLIPSLEIGSFGLITDFVSKNIGIAYTIKEFVKEDIKNKRVKEVKTDLKIMPRDLSVITAYDSVNSFVCHKFISELEKYFKCKK